MILGNLLTGSIAFLELSLAHHCHVEPMNWIHNPAEVSHSIGLGDLPTELKISLQSFTSHSKGNSSLQIIHLILHFCIVLWCPQYTLWLYFSTVFLKICISQTLVTRSYQSTKCNSFLIVSACHATLAKYNQSNIAIHFVSIKIPDQVSHKSPHLNIC